jgi:hypothetical protein
LVPSRDIEIPDAPSVENSKSRYKVVATKAFARNVPVPSFTAGTVELPLPTLELWYVVVGFRTVNVPTPAFARYGSLTNAELLKAIDVSVGNVHAAITSPCALSVIPHRISSPPMIPVETRPRLNCGVCVWLSISVDLQVEEDTNEYRTGWHAAQLFVKQVVVQLLW